MSRWLRLCTLAVGVLAASIPPLAAVNPRSLSDEILFPRFKDVAETAGIRFWLDSGTRTRSFLLETSSAGILLIDYDDDGWIDIYMVNGSTPERMERRTKSRGNRLYRNNRNGTFTDVTPKAGVAGSGAWGMGGCVGDVDNNGFDDIFITNYGHDVLYLNNGDATFRDASHEAGIAGGARWHSGCAFGDYDRDGDLDLYVSVYAEFSFDAARKDRQFMYHRMPTGSRLYQLDGESRQAAHRGPEAHPAQAHEFYENVGGRFIDAGERSGIKRSTPAYGFGVVWGDYDNDGDPDIFVANDVTPNYLFRNNGNKTFTERGLVAGVAFDVNGNARAGMGADMADYDNDGHLDITVTNFSGEYHALYRNDGRSTFTDVAQDAGFAQPTQPFVGWGTQFVDLDLDGFQDLIAVNGHVHPHVDQETRLTAIQAGYRQRRLLFRNRQDGTFEEIGAKLGRPFAQAHGSRGLAVGDLNNDGQMDLVIANQEEPPSVLANQGMPGRSWSLIKLRGTRSNRSAIGARVTVRAEGRSQMREVKSGGSYLSQSDLRVHFGLGAASHIDHLEIRWPSGRVQVERAIPVNQITVLREK